MIFEGSYAHCDTFGWLIDKEHYGKILFISFPCFGIPVTSIVSPICKEFTYSCTKVNN